MYHVSAKRCDNHIISYHIGEEFVKRRVNTCNMHRSKLNIMLAYKACNMKHAKDLKTGGGTCLYIITVGVQHI